MQAAVPHPGGHAPDQGQNREDYVKLRTQGRPEWGEVLAAHITAHSSHQLPQERGGRVQPAAPPGTLKPGDDQALLRGGRCRCEERAPDREPGG